jgi:mannose-1-phosphate guanylyltransferase
MLIPLIISGGSGARLWPISREAHPKPFMRLPDGQSLLQKTFCRAAALDNVRNVLTVTNREYYFKSRDEYQAAGECCEKVSSAFLLEPLGRNTAAAIALGALNVSETYGDDVLMLVLPADHLIEDQAAFAASVKQAETQAKRGNLVTFGIVPDTPETGFGYIECGSVCDELGSRSVERFVEKPSFGAAREYVESGRYLWNSGMFFFQAGVVLEQLQQYSPLIYQHALDCWKATRQKSPANSAMVELDSETFAAIPEDSIDYALMEKSNSVVVVPSCFGWSDIGSWNAISNMALSDEAGNCVTGEAVLVDVGNTFIHGGERLIAVIGVDDMLIVDTPDALLVSHRERAQDVKKVVHQLKLMGHESHREHRTVSRPWGTYTVLEEGRNFKIKRIVVKPGASLSLQMHYHRSEHWVVVSGTANIESNGKSLIVKTNESTYISAGNKHRLENPGLRDLVIIEVQSGEYLGEDDIVRFDDVYGRT